MKKNCIVLSTLLAIWHPYVARAASFNCDKASNLLEKTICGDPEISSMDDRLSLLYHEDMSRLSPGGQMLLKKSEINWIQTYQAYHPETGASSTSYDDYLKAAYQTRLEFLKTAVFTKGRFTFLTLSHFCVSKLDTESTPSDPVIAMHEWEYPVSDGSSPSTLIQAWNAAVTPSDYATACSDKYVDTEVDYQIHSATTGAISALRHEMEFGHGGANPNHSQAGVTVVDAAEPHLLRISDVFDQGKHWKIRLMTVIQDNMPREPGDNMNPQDLATVVKKLAGDPGSWVLDPDGLTVLYQQGVIGSEAFGTPTETIPWSRLQNVLATNAPVP